MSLYEISQWGLIHVPLKERQIMWFGLLSFSILENTERTSCPWCCPCDYPYNLEWGPRCSYLGCWYAWIIHGHLNLTFSSELGAASNANLLHLDLVAKILTSYRFRIRNIWLDTRNMNMEESLSHMHWNHIANWFVSHSFKIHHLSRNWLLMAIGLESKPIKHNFPGHLAKLYTDKRG